MGSNMNLGEADQVLEMLKEQVNILPTKINKPVSRSLELQRHC